MNKAKGMDIKMNNTAHQKVEKDLMSSTHSSVSSIQNVTGAHNNEIGNWMRDAEGMPCFNYIGKIPYSSILPDGTKVKLPDDPWFLLGNYQLTLFTHVSGEYELITGQRSWGRVNQGVKRNSGMNRSVLEILDRGSVKESIPLTGINSLAADPSVCKRIFGCGFADYSYAIGDLSVERNLSVKPSSTPYNGTSAFLLTVTICNRASQMVDLAYTEAVTANYEEIQYQAVPPENKKVKYANSIFYDKENHLIGVNTESISEDPLLFPSRESMSMYEGFPPSLFIQSVSGDAALSDSNNEIAARHTFTLQAGEKKVIRMIIGFAFEDGASSIGSIIKELTVEPENGYISVEHAPASAFSEYWMEVLPAFDDEQDDELRQELRWHAYTLEAMATYSDYYKETKIPQGTIYDYDWGVHASARDNFQHALPLVYYNPQLARSVLRYMLKRTTPFGDILLMEKGNGYAGNERYFASDQQLFFFMLLSEYLRVTGDYEFLKDEVEPYPVVNQAKTTVLNLLEKCFIFLRDDIRVGSHGLVRLLNSDWNDAVYYIVDVPYNTVLFTGESHMNSAMAISILQDLIPELHNAGNIPAMESSRPKIEKLCKSMKLYRSSVLEAFMKDLGDRTFPRRMYFNGKAYGDDNMFLEPQGYTLLIDELPEPRKKVLYNEMLQRVYSGEKLGAREQETPEFEDEHFDKGSRENGGFWWALNGPVILGVSQFDKAEARRLIKNMTFSNYAKSFPEYWSSYWSAADNVESSLIPEEGLPDQSNDYSNIPVFCAHPHAWILYCWLRLNERSA
ncbi:GH36-type glycosyl hydrolase domain-containing protein [Paenibacillus sp. DS2015]|uniref:GH36-type glycosyl hydrolase domain-containing protein n=1 Tax=Paenibacillus sp. DS2015 TaxID=3373917 RepID=UPI003D1CE185